VLQDVHWSRGGFGYFPTYSLGNVISVQIWERLRADVGDVDEQIARGEFRAIREWLRENLHRHGRKFTRRDARARRRRPIDPSRTSLSAGEARRRMIERVCVVGAGVIGSLFAGHLGACARSRCSAGARSTRAR
jgi:NADPH-dependent 2,4-dienoyl-CoA reductase/sulfur reductase-like enzyme